MKTKRTFEFSRVYPMLMQHLKVLQEFGALGPCVFFCLLALGASAPVIELGAVDSTSTHVSIILYCFCYEGTYIIIKCPGASISCILSSFSSI